MPGSWFGGTEMGSLNASERRQKYKAQAVEYAVLNKDKTLASALRLHLTRSTQDLECTQHSVHSKLCALECTQH